jgi:O-acetyl-ADP-ribose deacetylase (regulator of RNase III)
MEDGKTPLILLVMSQTKHLKDDLVLLAQEGTFDIIAHGTNCFCQMRAGIAKQIADAFPEAELADNATRSTKFMKIGTLTFCEVELPLASPKPLWVVNLYTQFQPGGGNFDYDALTICARKLNVLCQKFGQTYQRRARLGIPRIGAGIAGGEWNVIKSILERELIAPELTIVDYASRPATIVEPAITE